MTAPAPAATDRVVARVRRATTAPLTAGLVLFACYLLASAALDPAGYLGTDTGTKVHTLEVMDREGSSSPDIGYWAEDLDPSGDLHPLHNTKRQPDGSWVGVTTLPMLEVARPLYAIGGYRATLVLPMLGAVAAAFAARHLARRLRPSTDGWSAFWVTGLGSPLFVYALDFWEHSLGVACVLWAVVVLLGVAAERPAWHAVLAGVLLGAGAVMRQEVLVYALVGTAVVCAAMVLERRHLARPVIVGLSTVIGFAAAWTANARLESAVAGPSRAARSSGAAAAATSEVTVERSGDRIQEGLQTLAGLVAGDAAVSFLLGAVVVGAIVAAARAHARGDATFARVALGAVLAIYLADAVGGLGFVPGMLTAFPLAVGGLLAWRADRRVTMVVAIAVASLPIVYAFQYVGGGPPQWGGRYTLASGAVLGVVALVVLADRRTELLRGLVGLSVVVTLLGVAWLAQRTHGSERFFDDVVAEAEPVVIARQAFLLREAGPLTVDRRWLSVEDEAEFTRAVDIARTIGEERFTVLEWEAEAPPDDALPSDVREVERVGLTFVNTPVGLVTYEFT